MACVLDADDAAALLGVCCGGVALLAALVSGFLLLSGFAFGAGVSFEVSVGPDGLCGGLALIGGCACCRLVLVTLLALGLVGGASGMDLGRGAGGDGGKAGRAFDRVALVDGLAVWLAVFGGDLLACCGGLVRSCASAARCACVGIGDLSGVAPVMMSGGMVS